MESSIEAGRCSRADRALSLARLFGGCLHGSCLCHTAMPFNVSERGATDGDRQSQNPRPLPVFHFFSSQLACTWHTLHLQHAPDPTLGRPPSPASKTPLPSALCALRPAPCTAAAAMITRQTEPSGASSAMISHDLENRAAVSTAPLLGAVPLSVAMAFPDGPAAPAAPAPGPGPGPGPACQWPEWKPRTLQGPSAKEWALHRDTIIRLYRQHPLKRVRDIMQRHYGFSAR